jgi:tyrosine-protein phosphatase SIW14
VDFFCILWICWLTRPIAAIVAERFAMKHFRYGIFVLLLNAAPAVSQQSGAPNNAALASSGGKISAAVSQPVVAVRAIGVPAEKLRIVGVPNAGRIGDVLFRGAQPSAQGLAELKKLGVTTIVDLRGNRGEVQWERSQSEALGMRFVNIPVTGWSSPADAQVAQFLKLFGDPSQKVFVHCRFGEDRTGVMVAAYRIAAQKWTADQALGEMNAFGFHYHLYRGMRSYIRKFPDNYASEGTFAALRGSPAAP